MDMLERYGFVTTHSSNVLDSWLYFERVLIRLMPLVNFPVKCYSLLKKYREQGDDRREDFAYSKI